MIIAGEASGDVLAAELVTALRAESAFCLKNDPDSFSPRNVSSRFEWQFYGVGGPKMKDSGVELFYDLTEHAVVGLWEVLKHYPELKRLFNQLLQIAEQRMPDVIVLVDYPGFNLRFVKAIKKIVRQKLSWFHNWNPKIVYYVSPQIWAWHSSRVHQIARDVDLMLCIFPFEKKWYEERVPGFRIEYVGHPLLDRYPRADQKQSAESVIPLVLLLPGSREGELKKHLPEILGSCNLIAARHKVRFRMVLPKNSLVVLAKTLLTDRLDIEISVGQLASSLKEATAAIASSGTVTMECAYFGVPTVVIYKTSWSTYQLGKRFIHVKYLAMPNLLADEAIFPELIQNVATASNIALELEKFLTQPALRKTVQEKLSNVVASLGIPGGASRAAKAILAGVSSISQKINPKD